MLRLGSVWKTLTNSVGKINPLPGGNSLVVLTGSNVSINWTFTDDPTRTTLEWFFEPGDGSSRLHLATKYPGGKAQLQSSSLSRVTIEDPATLVLTNVDHNYNGTYFLVLKVIGALQNEISQVVVLIARKFLKCRLFIQSFCFIYIFFIPVTEI